MSNGFLQLRPWFGWLCIAVLLAAMLLPTLLQAQTGNVIYVRPTATGTGDGSSWANATTLQDALRNRARLFDEIWLAAGVYTPGPNPGDIFEMVPGVAVYGGFAGNETAREQRDPAANLTVFSGDIAGDDRNKSNGITPTAEDIVGTNTNTLVAIDSNTINTIFDGITLTGGQAVERISLCNASCGGGMRVRGSPILANLRFIGNYSSGNGGGLYTYGWVTLRDSHFAGNQAENGAGLFMDYNTLGPLTTVVTLEGGSFVDNLASRDGGGAYTDGVQFLASDVEFIGNQAQAGDGGGLYVDFASLTMTNAVFLGNQARGTGGLRIIGSTRNQYQTVLTNAAFAGNRGILIAGAISCETCQLTGSNLSITGNLGGLGAGGIHSSGLDPRLNVRNSIIWGNYVDGVGYRSSNLNSSGAAQLNHNLIEGLNLRSFGNLDGTDPANEPQFVAAPDAANAPQTMADLQLRLGSPAIDAGDNDLNDTINDPAGNPRIGNTIIDLGAYESGAASPELRLDPASDSGFRNNDSITNLTTPDFIGQVQAGSTVVLNSSLDGLLGTATADGNGEWRLTAPTMREGQHLVTASVNGNPTAVLNVLIDISGPTLRINHDYVQPGAPEVRLYLTFNEAAFGFTRDDIEVREVPAGISIPERGIYLTGRERYYQASIIHYRETGASGEITLAVPDGAVTDAAGNPGVGNTVTYLVLLPDNFEEVCPATSASLAATGLAQTTGDEPLQLGLLYDLRDRVLRESAEGRRLVDVYYANGAEISGLMFANPGLMMQGIETLITWQPEVRALTSGSGDRALISEEHVQVTNAFLDNLAAAGSPELQQTLSQERATIQLDSLIGQTMNEATQNVIDVDPAELDLGEPVFLPYVTRW